MAQCRDLMTKDPVTCLPGDTTAEAAQLMRDHDTGMIPVVSNLREKKLLGVLTDRDLALRVVAEGRDSTRWKVESIVSRLAASCSPDDPYEYALQMMERHQIRRLPVVDGTGRIVGIISQADVALRVHDRSQTAEVVREISRKAA
jgi:CBS domain-containing protein